MPRVCRQRWLRETSRYLVDRSATSTVTAVTVSERRGVAVVEVGVEEVEVEVVVVVGVLGEEGDLEGAEEEGRMGVGAGLGPGAGLGLGPGGGEEEVGAGEGGLAVVPMAHASEGRVALPSTVVCSLQEQGQDFSTLSPLKRKCRGRFEPFLW